jgi:hypothetical protein
MTRPDDIGGRSDSDAAYARFPALPVRVCAGYDRSLIQEQS